MVQWRGLQPAHMTSRPLLLTDSRRVLVVTDDAELQGALLRLAALAGVEVHACAPGPPARRLWLSAPLVLVGGRCPGMPRRGGVIQVSTDLDDASIWQRGVENGADHVVLLPDAEDWLVSRLARGADGVDGLDGLVVGVIGGRGGSGASVLAAALAVTARRAGLRVCLVDGDPLGGGLDLVLGGESAPGLRWPDLGRARGRVEAGALVDALPVAGGVPVLSWDRDSSVGQVPVEAMEAVLSAARRVHELVVVDLPRSADDAARGAVELADAVLLVVPAEVRATAAASRLLATSLLGCRDPRVVVRVPGPAHLSGDEVAGALGLPLAGTYELEPALEGALERGDPPARRGRGSLADLCGSLLTELLPGAQVRAA